jgi:serine/threonine protein kinase
VEDPFDLVGDVLEGQFRVDRFVGEGDLSVVYQGHHLGVDAPVAIKCLNLPATLDPALVRPLVESFRDASKIHYRLARGSLHIAQSISSGRTIAPRTGGTLPYLVREWFEGESLASDLARRRSEGKKGRTLQEAMTLLEPAIEGVGYAHEHGVAHLSLNPSNLFIARRDDSTALKVLDFGVARTMNELSSGLPPDSRPPEGLRVLFPAYAAPEQLDRSAGDTGPWTDVYAISLILMELLSDRVVMQGGDSGALVERALDEKHRPTPGAHGLHLARNMELVLTRALARSPQKRQKDAGAFWKDVKSALRGTASRAMPAVVSQAPAPPPVPPAAQLPVPPPAEPAAPPPVPIRAKSATLMGIAPGILVVGAVAARQGPPSVPGSTLPMSFEPSMAPVDAPAPRVITAKLPPPLEAPPAARPEVPRLPAPKVVALMAAGCTLALVIPVIVVVVGTGAQRGVAATPVTSVSTPVATAVPPPPADPAPDPSVVPPASTARFSVGAARRALDAVSGDVTRCRRGGAWGVSQAKVTFANDGSVSQVFVGPPFGGTPTGQCVKDTMGAVQVPPFAGDPAVFMAQFYVAPR